METNKQIRIGLITVFILIFLAVTFVLFSYPYPESLMLKIAYGIIIIAFLYGIWAIYVLTKSSLDLK